MILSALTFQQLLDLNSPAAEWVLPSVQRLLHPEIKDRVGFAFDDPPEYGTSDASFDVFPKLLDHLTNPESNLSDANLIKLVSAFTERCTEENWKTYFQPILQRKVEGDRLISRVNRILPEEDRIKPFEVPELIDGMPEGNGYFYPYGEDYNRMFFYVTEDTVDAFGTTFIPFDDCEPVELFEPLLGQKDIEYPLVFEAVDDGVETTLTDMFTLSGIEKWPGQFRRELLEAAHAKYFEDTVLMLGEGLRGSEKSDLDQIQSHFDSLILGTIEPTHAALFKPADKPYSVPAILVPLHSPEGVEV